MKTYRLVITIGILIALFLVVARQSRAFNIKLTNDINRDLVYNVIWLECDWPGFPPKQSMAMGEIKAGDINDLEVDYVAGPYIVQWYGRSPTLADFDKEYPITVESDKGILTATPTKKPVFIPGI